VCLRRTTGPKRILLMWIKGSLDISIGPRAVEEISATLKSLKACISCELVRKPRSLDIVHIVHIDHIHTFLKNVSRKFLGVHLHIYYMQHLSFHSTRN
jgi:hypothetical protein